MNLIAQAEAAYAASVAETEQRAREATERVKRDRAYQLALLLRKRLDLKVDVTDCTVDIDGLRFGLNTSTIPPTLMVSRPCSGCGTIPDPALGAPVTDLVSLGSELSLPAGKCGSCRRKANAAVAVAQETPWCLYPAELHSLIRDAVTAARPEGFDDADIAAFLASVLAEVEHRLEGLHADKSGRSRK